MEYYYTVTGDNIACAGQASSKIKKRLKALNVPQEIIKRVSIAMHEAEMNMAVHAGGGIADVFVDKEAITIVRKMRGLAFLTLSLPCRTGIPQPPDSRGK